MIENIVLSKDNILNKYSNLEYIYKDAIEVIYGKQKSNLFTIYNFDNVGNDIIDSYCRSKNDKDNNTKCALRKKTGVYLFIDKDEIVYIGVGGTGKTDDILKRIDAEVRVYDKTNNSNATLSKNISDVDSLLLNKDVTYKDSLDKIKTLKLLVISIGNMSKQKNKLISKSLEQVLIALFNSRYNK